MIGNFIYVVYLNLIILLESYSRIYNYSRPNISYHKFESLIQNLCNS